MSKTMKILLCLAMVAALAVMTVLFLRYRSNSKTLSDLTAQLEVSRTSWENTAAEKEALQKELRTVSGNLREAQLSLEENTERAEELTAQIETLKQEIAALEKQ